MPHPVRKFSIVKDYVSGEQFLGIYVGINLTSVQANAMQHYLETDHFSAARTLLQRIAARQGIEVSAVIQLMFDFLENRHIDRVTSSTRHQPEITKEDGNLIVVSGTGDDDVE